MIMALLANPAFANDKSLIIAAVFFCALLAGLWQAVLGLAGVAKVIKFTPHPVLVGFLNGVAVLIAVSQLKPYFFRSAAPPHLMVIDPPGVFPPPLRGAGPMLGFSALAEKI